MPCDLISKSRRQLAKTGCCFIHGNDLSARLCLGSEAWADFASSWSNLRHDTYMGDGGTYRQRRHACFNLSPGKVVRNAHGPHYLMGDRFAASSQKEQ